MREFDRERAHFIAWARWAGHDDISTVFRQTGLSRYGSPPSPMFAKMPPGEDPGAIRYNQETRPAPPVGPVVERFMIELQEPYPMIFKALICRHLCRVDGHTFIHGPENWRAQCLYGTKRSAAHRRLVLDCDFGYGRFRDWMAFQLAADRPHVAIVTI